MTLGPVIFYSAWSRLLPTSHRPRHHPTGHALIGRALYSPRREEASFVDGRLDALELCVFERLGVRHEVVGALSVLEPNDPCERRLRCAVLSSEASALTQIAEITKQSNQ